MSELRIAPIIPILGINVQNLVQAFLRTCYLLIWVLQLEFQEQVFATNYALEAEYLHTEQEPYPHYKNKDVTFQMYPGDNFFQIF